MLQILALQNLESNGWTSKFFSLWFENIDSFSRVHDKKLSICAIVALLELNPAQLPVSVQQGWSKLIQGVVRLFQTLPAAMKSKPFFIFSEDTLTALKTAKKHLKTKDIRLIPIVMPMTTLMVAGAKVERTGRKMMQKRHPKSRMKALHISTF